MPLHGLDGAGRCSDAGVALEVLVLLGLGMVREYWRSTSLSIEERYHLAGWSEQVHYCGDLL